MLALGEDNIVWSTDSVWYSPTQPPINASRASISPRSTGNATATLSLPLERRRKSLGSMLPVYAASIQGRACRRSNDDLAWVEEALEEYSKKGTPTVVQNVA